MGNRACFEFLEPTAATRRSAAEARFSTLSSAPVRGESAPVLCSGRFSSRSRFSSRYSITSDFDVPKTLSTPDVFDGCDSATMSFLGERKDHESLVHFGLRKTRANVEARVSQGGCDSMGLAVPALVTPNVFDDVQSKQLTRWMKTSGTLTSLGEDQRNRLRRGVSAPLTERSSFIFASSRHRFWSCCSCCPCLQWGRGAAVEESAPEARHGGESEATGSLREHGDHQGDCDTFRASRQSLVHHEHASCTEGRKSIRSSRMTAITEVSETADTITDCGDSLRHIKSTSTRSHAPSEASGFPRSDSDDGDASPRAHAASTATDYGSIARVSRFSTASIFDRCNVQKLETTAGLDQVAFGTRFVTVDCAGEEAKLCCLGARFHLQRTAWGNVTVAPRPLWASGAPIQEFDEPQAPHGGNKGSERAPRLWKGPLVSFATADAYPGDYLHLLAVGQRDAQMLVAPHGRGWEPVAGEASPDAWTPLWSDTYAGHSVVMLAKGKGGGLGKDKPRPFAIASAVDAIVRVQVRWNLRQASCLLWSDQQEVDPERRGVFREVLLCALQSGEPSIHVPEGLKAAFHERFERREHWKALRQKQEFAAIESGKPFALDLSWREPAGERMASREIEHTAMAAVKDFVQELFVKKRQNSVGDFCHGRNLLVPQALLLEVMSTDVANEADRTRALENLRPHGSTS